MNKGDTVFYTDLSAEKKYPFMLQASIVDVMESEGVVGSRGHKTFMGLKISEDELKRIRNWRLGSFMDYDKWSRTQYIPTNMCTAYSQAMKIVHDRFWSANQ